MLDEKIEKQICKRIDSFDESLKYMFDALCELKSGLNTISYLLQLSKKKDLL